MITAPNLSRRPRWGRALLFAGGMHAAAIGALFVRLSSSVDPSAETPAIALELAALPAAPVAVVRDAPTPRQIEAPKRTQPKPSNPKELPFKPPPLSAANTEPEVVLPLEQKESPVVQKSSPLPPAPTTTELASPDLDPNEKVKAPNVDVASAGKTSESDHWDARVLARIEMTKRYPRRAIANNQQDDVQIMLAIDRRGRLKEAQVMSSRGFELLNEAALEAVHRAAPFPEPPNDIDGDPIRLSVIVRFVKKSS